VLIWNKLTDIDADPCWSSTVSVVDCPVSPAGQVGVPAMIGERWLIVQAGPPRASKR
jgi:hypothetical protein